MSESAHTIRGGPSGELRIEMRTAGSRRLTPGVEDDRVGSPPGLDIARIASFGLQMVTVLVRQVGGTIELGQTPDTRVHIRFNEPGMEVPIA